MPFFLCTAVNLPHVLTSFPSPSLIFSEIHSKRDVSPVLAVQLWGLRSIYQNHNDKKNSKCGWTRDQIEILITRVLKLNIHCKRTFSNLSLLIHPPLIFLNDTNSVLLQFEFFQERDAKLLVRMHKLCLLFLFHHHWEKKRWLI